MLTTTQINEIIIGIDVSKDKLDIFLLPMGEHLVLRNDPAAISKFLDQFLQKFSVTQVKMCVMESTGGYEKRVAKLLVGKGFPIHISHPNQVYYFAKSRKLFAKTDKIDAKILALFGAETDLRESPLMSKEAEELKDLTIRKLQLKELLTIEKCRLKDHLTSPSRKSIERSVKQIEREVALVEEKIKERVESCEDRKNRAAILKTLKGVGEQTAYTLVATLPELGRLNRSQIAALTGLAPRNNDSGTKRGYRAVQGGRFYVRKALYMPALSALRYNRPLKEYYERLVEQGKKRKVAVVAVMRKMIITMNAMIKNNESWAPAF